MRTAFVLTAAMFCIAGAWYKDHLWFLMALGLLWVVVLIDTVMQYKDEEKAK